MITAIFEPDSTCLHQLKCKMSMTVQSICANSNLSYSRNHAKAVGTKSPKTFHVFHSVLFVSADSSLGRFYARSCQRLGLSLAARCSSWSNSGPDGHVAAPVACQGFCGPGAVLATACCTATANMPLHQRAQADVAAQRRAGEARWARRQTGLRAVIPSPAHFGAQKPFHFQRTGVSNHPTHHPGFTMGASYINRSPLRFNICTSRT